MELSVRSFYREIKEDGCVLLRFEGATLSVSESKTALAFYRDLEAKTIEAVNEIAKTEKQRYAACRAAKERFSYRPICVRTSYEAERKEGVWLVKRQAQLLRKGRLFASFEDVDTWQEDGILIYKKERKRKQKLSISLCFMKFLRHLPRIFRKAS